MGRVKRLHRQAVQAGIELSFRQRRKNLMVEVIRLASQQLFFDETLGDIKVEMGMEAIGAAIGKVLPEALRTCGVGYFTTDELSRDPDWDIMRIRMIQGIAAKMTELRKMDTRGDVWRIRKTKSGRKPTGKWVLCLDCGTPRWCPANKDTKRCRPCYLKAPRKRRRTVVTAEYTADSSARAPAPS